MRHVWMFGCRRAKEKWLFHGAEKATILKINRNSFTRSFCGKNTTAYGKGVYFAVKGVMVEWIEKWWSDKPDERPFFRDIVEFVK